MHYILQIGQLEEAINRCKRAQPFSNGVLPPDLRIMAELYGEMIFRHLDSINLETQSPLLRAVFAKWATLADRDIASKAAPICSLRTGDTGFDGCEACQ